MKKSYDCIVAIGCSHLFGYDHSSTDNNTRPSKDTWVNLLAKHFNTEVFNYSQPGGTAQSILRRLYVALNYIDSNNLNPIFILQWPSFTRYENYVSDSYYVCEDWPWTKANTEINNASNSINLKHWAENIYKTFDFEALLYDNLNIIHHANLLISSKKFTTINCFGNNWELDLHNFESRTEFVSSDSIASDCEYSIAVRNIYKQQGFTLNQSLLDKHNVEGYINNKPFNIPQSYPFLCLKKDIDQFNWWTYNKEFGYGLKQFCQDNQLSLNQSNHASEDAHKFITDYMLSDKDFMQLFT